MVVLLDLKVDPHTSSPPTQRECLGLVLVIGHSTRDTPKVLSSTVCQGLVSSTCTA